MAEYPVLTPPSNPLEVLGHRWLTYWHGEGAPHQFRYYRCKECRGLVTWKQIRDGGCRCGATKVTPANLRWKEKVKVLCLPWTV